MVYNKAPTVKEIVHQTANDYAEEYQFMAFEETKNRDLYYWNKKSGLWEPAEIFLRKKIEKYYEEHADEKFIKAVIDKLKNRYPKKISEIPTPPTHLIPLKTAVWDIEKMKPILYTPEHYFFSKANIDAHEGKEFPTIKRFEETLFGNDQEKITLFRKIMAFPLCNGYPLKKAIIFYGPGDCGKSACVRLAEEITGVENTTNNSLQDLLFNQFRTWRLQFKKLNTYADLPSSIVKNVGKLKALTGGDRISGEGKGKDAVDFYNNTKFIFGANEIPAVDPDEADPVFFGRWEFLDFENIIPMEERDENIIDKLKPELDAYGYVLMQSLKQLLADKHFTKKTHEECQTIWMAHSTSAMRFVEECIIQSPGDSIEQTFVNQKYREYCEERKIPLQSAITLGKAMKTLSDCFLHSSSMMKNGVKQTIKAWRNVKINLDVIPTIPTTFSSYKGEIDNSYKNAEKTVGSVGSGNSLTLLLSRLQSVKELPREEVIAGIGEDAFFQAKKDGLIYEPRSGWIMLSQGGSHN